MSSSEEYLDNLLKTLLGNENNTEGAQKEGQESPEAVFSATGDMPAKESNKAMSTDEIEEMFASMGEGIVTSTSKTQKEPAESGDLSTEEPEQAGISGSDSWGLEEELVPEEPESGQEDALGPADWALEEDLMPEEPEPEGEGALGSADWALEEDLLPEEPEPELGEVSEPVDWALEEDLLPEEPEPEQEEVSEPVDWALEEDLLPEEPEPEGEGVLGSADWALEEELLPEEPEPEQEEVSEPVDWALEEDLLPEEPEPEREEALGSADWALEDDLLAEESEPERAESSEAADWAPEEELQPAGAEWAGSSGTEDWALKEELLPEEPEPERTEASEPDDWAPEEDSVSVPETEWAEASGSDDWGLEEESLPEEPEQNEAPKLDSLTLEEDILPDSMESEEVSVPGNTQHETEEGSELEEWNLDEDVLTEDKESDLQSGLEDWGLEEETQPEQMTEEITTGDGNTVSDFETEEELAMTPETGEDKTEDAALTDLETDGPDTDIFGMEEEPPAGSTMSEEEVDRLLGDDFALDESGEDDEGLSELLESMGHDEDLSEINDLLEKADRGVMEDDDMLALLGGPLADEAEESNDVFDFWGQDDEEELPVRKTQETVPVEDDEEVFDKKGKKKKEKKGKKVGKKNMKDTTERGKAEGEQAKKQGIFARLQEFLLEDDDFPEDDTDHTYGGNTELGSLSEENAELLEELDAEDKKNSSKKDTKKKDKKKKEKKKKEKKPKKAPKPKKPKKEKKVSAEENGVPEKKISRTKIVFVCVFCISVAACILVVNMFMPDYMQKQEAKEMYDDGRYEETYALLYGKELSEEEDALLQRSNIILQVKQKLQSYGTYNKLDMQPEALNALIEGVERYQMFRMDAEQYGVTSEIDDIYTQILSALSENYGVSEADAMDILTSESDLVYSEKIYGILNGTGIESTEDTAGEQPEVKQDVLPEEEEIIDRLDNPEVSE